MYPPSLQDLGIHGLHKLPRIKGKEFLRERLFSSVYCTNHRAISQQPGVGGWATRVFDLIGNVILSSTLGSLVV